MDYSVPFKSLTLARAAKYFNCEIEDFIQWHELGLIKICIECETDKAYLLKMNDNYTENGNIHSELLDMGEYEYRDEKTIFHAEYIREDHNEVRRPYGYLCGYIVPDIDVIKYLSSTANDLATNFVATPYNDVNYRLIFIIDKVQNHYIFEIEKPKSYRYVPEIRKESLVIINHDLLVIRDLLNPPPKNTGSQKTVNAMAKFIKQLVAANYGNDVANSPRKHVDGKDGAIQKHFGTLEMEPPSGNTVEAWIKNIDLD